MKRLVYTMVVIGILVTILPTISLAGAGLPSMTWYDDGALVAGWTMFDTDKYDFSYDIQILYCDTESGEYERIAYQKEWADDCFYTINPLLLAEYGEGYYKFRVAVNGPQSHQISDESDAYHYAPSSFGVVMPAPTNLVFNEETGKITFDAPVSSNGERYEDNCFITELYYLGEDGTSEPKLFKRLCNTGTSAWISGFGMNNNAPDGFYTIAVSTFSDDYMNEGKSENAWLGDSFYYEDTTPALEAPSGLVWDGKQAIWDVLNLGSDAYYVLEFMYSEDWTFAPERVWTPVASYSLTMEELFASDTDVAEYVKSYSDGLIVDNGKGWYYFRVQAYSCNSDYESSNWSYAQAVFFEQEPLARPSDLYWGRKITSSSENGHVYINRTGYASFRTVENGENYELRLNYVDETGVQTEVVCLDYYEDNGPTYVSFDLRPYITKNGEYFFTVLAKDEDDVYRESDLRTSSKFTFTPPDAELPPMEGTWDRNLMTWIPLKDEEHLDYYEINLYAADDETITDTAEMELIETYNIYPGKDWPNMTEQAQEQEGEKHYWFEVRAVTRDFTMATTGEWSDLIGPQQYVMPEMKAPQATNLEWNVRCWSNDNKETANGFISFRGQQGYDYQLEVWRISESGSDELIYNGFYSAYKYDDYYVSVNPFEKEERDEKVIFTTGTYYYTVTTEGDDNSTQDSEPARSENWEYVRPETALIATDLQWSDQHVLSWKCENEEYVDRYSLTFYFSNTENGAYWKYDLSQNTVKQECNAANILSEGEGWYYYRVDTKTNDVCKAINGTSEVFGPVKYTPPTNLASAPTDLTWHVYRDEETGEIKSRTGVMSFKGIEGTQYQVELHFSSDGTKYHELYTHKTFPLEGLWGNVDRYIDDFQEGWYKFCIYALGDKINTTDSEPVWSEVWQFTPSDLVLTLTVPKWDTVKGLPTATWTNIFDDMSLVDEYEVTFYFSETEGGEYEECWRCSYPIRYIEEEGYPAFDIDLISDYGYGWYKFAVQAYTADATKAQTGDMTELSDAYHLKEPETKEEPPTKLQWHVYYSTKTDEGSYSPGAISFKGAVDKTYRMELYYSKNGQEYELYSSKKRNMTSEYYSWTVLSDDAETGWYKFCVYAMGDMLNTGNSEVVWSEPWQYVVPELVLEVSEPVWETTDGLPVMSWKCAFEDLSLVESFEVEVCYAETENDKFEEYDSFSYSVDEFLEKETVISNELLMDCGSGWYKFAVQAYTTDFLKAQNGKMTEYSAAWEYVKPETQAAAPTDLTWHVYRNEETGETESAPGVMSFQGTVGTEYRVELYYSSNGTKYKEYDYETVLLEDPWHNNDWFVGEFEEGWYKFCVYALGDAINTTNSEPVWSEVWQFIPPDLVLELSEPKWDVSGELPTMTWKCGFDDLSLLDRYRVLFYFSETENGKFVKVGNTSIYAEDFEESDKIEIPTDILLENGSGCYKFTVQAYTADFTKAQTGEVTEYSDAWCYVEPEAKMESPFGLAWHTSRYSGGEKESPGVISFLGEKGVEYTTQLYYSSDGKTYRQSRSETDTLSSSWGNWNAIKYITNYGSGWYKFCVYAHGDVVNTINSDVVWSDVWQFVAPDQVLELCEPKWDVSGEVPAMTWTCEFDDLSLAEEYYVTLYFSKTEGGVFTKDRGIYIDAEEFEENGKIEIPTNILIENESGWYKFNVRAYTADLTKAQSGEATILSEAYCFTEPETKAEAPAELQWHVWRDPETGAAKDEPAWISFHGDVGNIYTLKLYYSEDRENYELDRTYRVTLENPWYNRNMFVRNYQTAEGWYRFCIYTQGDMVHTANSDVIWSEIWQYIAPDLTLEVTDPKWDTSKKIPTITWTNLFEGTEYVYCYDIDISWGKTQNGAYETWSYTVYPEEIGTDGTVVIDSDVLTDLGAGWYKFKVLACSNDITKAQTGPYSVWSDTVYFDGQKDTATDVKNQLDTILSSAENMSAEEVKAAVSQVDKTYLAEALAADTGNDGVVGQIQQLEIQTGIETKISKADDMAVAIDPDKVSVVGAALNAEAGVDEVSLIIGDAENNFVLKDQYAGTIPFSLHLNIAGDDGSGSGSQYLAVPVKITLPIPDGINPSSLVILHRLTDDTVEEIQPYAYCEDSLWYASFVVTGFSDFAFAWKIPAHPVQAVTAKTISGGVRVQVNLVQGIADTVFCAAYHENGQMLGIVQLLGKEAITIPCNNAYRVKVFLVDDRHAPICSTVEAFIQG